MQLIKTIFHHLGNIPGWHTDRRIIVFESDDWGSIRMPSKDAFHALGKAGIHLNKDPYSRFDALESNNDLLSLFDVLTGFKDTIGNHPVFTAVSVIANPDFDRIRKSGFTGYFSEPFTETLKRYPEHEQVYNLWKKGIENKIFIPQFHGREHLNVQRWMRDLQSGNEHTLHAFNLGLWAIYSEKIETEYQAAFDPEFQSDLAYMHTILTEGLMLFEQLLGYRARFFVPPNGPFNLSLESTLQKEGVRYIMLDKLQKEPLGNGKYRTHLRYLGKRNNSGQIYLSRNAGFEPAQFPGQDNIGLCLKAIDRAFRLKKPATISTHRVNYIGWLEPENRENTLNQLKELLRRILKQWPDAEFMTSVQLGDLIAKSGK